MIKNTLILDALNKKPTPRRPIWLMRQAGRYLPEYMATRAKAGSFMALCQNPELACEVTMQPIERYGLDAAILFSDILTIPDAMGLGLYFEANHGPRFEKTASTASVIHGLPSAGVNDDVDYVFQAVKTIKQALNDEIPLLGFSGSPWTLACYMVEGGGSKDFATIKKMMYQDPELLTELLNKLTIAVIEYLKVQIESGVDAVQLFDTWAGIHSEPSYQAFSLKYIDQIVAALKEAYPEVPIILFSKHAAQWLHLQKDLNLDCLSLDWTVSLKQARAITEDKFALQGNLDPQVLLSNPEVIQRETKRVLEDFGDGPGHVFNLGHGLTPDIPPEHVAVLVETVKGS